MAINGGHYKSVRPQGHINSSILFIFLQIYTNIYNFTIYIDVISLEWNHIGP